MSKILRLRLDPYNNREVTSDDKISLKYKATILEASEDAELKGTGGLTVRGPIELSLPMHSDVGLQMAYDAFAKPEPEVLIGLFDQKMNNLVVGTLGRHLSLLKTTTLEPRRHRQDHICAMASNDWTLIATTKQEGEQDVFWARENSMSVWKKLGIASTMPVANLPALLGNLILPRFNQFLYLHYFNLRQGKPADSSEEPVYSKLVGPSGLCGPSEPSGLSEPTGSSEPFEESELFEVSVSEPYELLPFTRLDWIYTEEAQNGKIPDFKPPKLFLDSLRRSYVSSLIQGQQWNMDRIQLELPPKYLYRLADQGIGSLVTTDATTNKFRLYLFLSTYKFRSEVPIIYFEVPLREDGSIDTTTKTISINKVYEIKETSEQRENPIFNVVELNGRVYVLWPGGYEYKELPKAMAISAAIEEDGSIDHGNWKHSYNKRFDTGPSPLGHVVIPDAFCATPSQNEE